MTLDRALSMIGAIAVMIFAAAAPASAQDRGYPPRPGYDEVPYGSYQRDCRNIRLDRNLLRAQCPSRRDGFITSALDVNGCQGRDIWNDDGYLRCAGGGGGGGPRPPWGPGQGQGPGPGRPPQGADAVAYTLPDFRGRELPISGPIQNLANYRGFNDQIRSIRVFRRELEVCVDKNYRGRCVRIRDSYRDLGEIGMNAAISSIR